jgi:uncharacterized pyridoxamine 5'-phosphate oxidase family protein
VDPCLREAAITLCAMGGQRNPKLKKNNKVIEYHKKLYFCRRIINEKNIYELEKKYEKHKNI